MTCFFRRVYTLIRRTVRALSPPPRARDGADRLDRINQEIRQMRQEARERASTASE